MMPHKRRSTGFGFRQRSKQFSVAARSSSSVGKYRLCVASLRASFQTRSIGESCGLYGGRKSRVSTRRRLRSQGARSLAWWYAALSSTITMRLPRERCRSNVLRNSAKVTALNFGDMARRNLPVRRLTAPKQAMDLRVGACVTTGSLTSGGTHMRHRVPCCWKWHSSRLHSSTFSRLANRRSFFCLGDRHRIGLGNLWPGLAEAKSHLAEDPLAPPPTERHAVVLFQMHAQQLAIPKVLLVTEIARAAPQLAGQLFPLPRIERPRPPGPLAIMQTGKSALLDR